MLLHQWDATRSVGCYYVSGMLLGQWVLLGQWDATRSVGCY